jgi:hypothetical protein
MTTSSGRVACVSTRSRARTSTAPRRRCSDARVRTHARILRVEMRTCAPRRTKGGQSARECAKCVTRTWSSCRRLARSRDESRRRRRRRRRWRQMPRKVNAKIQSSSSTPMTLMTTVAAVMRRAHHIKVARASAIDGDRRRASETLSHRRASPSSTPVAASTPRASSLHSSCVFLPFSPSCSTCRSLVTCINDARAWIGERRREQTFDLESC